jgi:hypothetical protein
MITHSPTLDEINKAFKTARNKEETNMVLLH